MNAPDPDSVGRDRGRGAADTWEQARQYAVDEGQLLFCPTRPHKSQFRSTLRDAVSHFVGGEPRHTEDAGFALEPWMSVRFATAGIVCPESTGMAIRDGSERQIEDSFVYVRGTDDRLVIQLHHSALPFRS